MFELADLPEGDSVTLSRQWPARGLRPQWTRARVRCGALGGGGDIGSVLAFVSAAGVLRRGDRRAAYQAARQDVGRAILLGLEILIIADIVLTITVDSTIESADRVAVLHGGELRVLGCTGEAEHLLTAIKSGRPDRTGAPDTPGPER
jgi:hypothetical protein